MKIALVNDTHFGARSDSSQFNEFFFKFWEQTFFPYLAEHQIKTLVHLGDVVDRRKFINHQTAHQFQMRFMRRLWQDGIDTHIIIGNHDTYHKNTNQINAIQNLCRSYDGIHEPWIYTNPQIVEFDGLPILFVPWICDENREMSLEMIRTAPVSCLMGHLEIAGFEMDRGMVCAEGMSLDLFQRFETVMSGHFHHRSHRGPIHYLGNQYEITWADYDDQRGFHVFDTATRELTFVPNPYTMFHKLIYDDDAQTFETWNKTDWSQYTNKCVKVVVQRKRNPYLFDSILDRLYQSTPLDVSVVENFLPISESFDETMIDQAEDTMVILGKYIDSLKIDVDAKQLKDFMYQLYQDATTADHIV